MVIVCIQCASVRLGMREKGNVGKVQERRHHFHDVQLLLLVHANGRHGMPHIVIGSFIRHSISPSVGVGRGSSELEVVRGARLQQEPVLIARIGANACQ
eukprot:11442252-Ditylum_brightwellii.AAC.1